MSDQLRSQCFGILLAVTTAIGCVAYERLVKAYSYFTVGVLVSLSYFFFWLPSLLITNTLKQDLCTLHEHKWSVLVFILSGVTGPLWYTITRKQSLLVGAGYEAKYIVVLAIAYLLFGKTTPSWSTLVGITCAVLSVYFLSR